MEKKPEIPKPSHTTDQAEARDAVAVGKETAKWQEELIDVERKDYEEYIAERQILQGRLDTARRENKTELVTELNVMLKELDVIIDQSSKDLTSTSDDQDELTELRKRNEAKFKKSLH